MLIESVGESVQIHVTGNTTSHPLVWTYDVIPVNVKDSDYRLL